MSSLNTMIRACSACSGDYEDPDRTSGPGVDDGETAEIEIAADWEDDPSHEVDLSPVSAGRSLENDDPPAD